MRLELDDEQAAVQGAFAALFGKESTPERVRAVEISGIDHDLWARLVEMGAPSMAVAEADGGAGASLVLLSLVAEEAGRAVAAAPLVDGCVGARLLGRLGRTDLAAACAQGTSLAALAVRSATGATARLVPSGAVADLVLVLADDQLVLARPVGERTPVANLGRLPIADVDLRGAEVLLSGDGAREAHRHALDEWCVLAAAALVGCATRAIEITVPYVKDRTAFGVPLATFQAVAHGLADADTAVEGARMLTRKAAWALDVDDASARRLPRMAFYFAAEAAEQATAAALHFHGGYGVMLEYDIHLYARAAKAWSLLWGDRTTALDDVADAILGAV
jgi:alkylation response protein AidB-like acyl-CoA dehydrogenase